MSKKHILSKIIVLWLSQSMGVAGEKQGVDAINPMIGAITLDGYGGHGLGKTFPGAATPFGMVQLSPDTITGGDNGPGYSAHHETIEGFSFTHMSGIGWYGDLGNFQVMAATPKGHAPEVNQFHVTYNVDEQVRRYLDQGVMHLALVRSPGTKATSDSDTQEYDYRLHPIFAPLFVFSHRKKSKFAIPAPQLVGLVEQPRKTIRDILAQSDRTDEENLPDQLQLFGGFYAGN